MAPMAGIEPAKFQKVQIDAGATGSYIVARDRLGAHTTSHIDVKGRQLALNEEGFLADPSAWDKDVAATLALTQEGLEALTTEHWAVIEFIRAHFLENNLAPMVRAICKTTGLPLKRIYELFPSGPAKGACKLAGLPKPDGCV
jgi:tRNA 2-thiouridine synthesizing protein E